MINRRGLYSCLPPHIQILMDGHDGRWQLIFGLFTFSVLTCFMPHMQEPGLRSRVDKKGSEGACMGSICWPYFDPEYETLNQRINPPRVSIDNATCSDCTLVKVDSVNKHGILLEVVQVLTDLDLSISKAYISSDGGWFMDVFHVTDQQGNKVTDPKMIEQIEKALGANGSPKTRVQSVGGEYTAIELMGSDRPGLLSEISAVLADLNCNVVAAQAWSHNTRIACVFYVTDSASSRRLDDPARLAGIQEHLRNVLRGGDGVAHTNVSTDLTRTDRRLHRMMSDDPDNELVVDGGYGEKAGPCCFRPRITVEGCDEKGYSVVNVRCKDRPKLLFDTVCTLTDMKYVVFHASIVSDGPYALQEYYIRHMDGCTLNSEAEKNHVIRSLEAAILRRVSDGVSLELSAKDRVGLLSDVTRVLRENGLTVMRAEVSTVGAKAVNVFYVRDASGNPVDMKTIESLRKEIGHTMLLNVKAPDLDKPSQSVGTTKFSFSFGKLFWKFLP